MLLLLDRNKKQDPVFICVCTRDHLWEWIIQEDLRVLEKDSSESKVLTITINSKLEQAFECSKEQSSSSIVIRVYKCVGPVDLKWNSTAFPFSEKSDIFPKLLAIKR